MQSYENAVVWAGDLPESWEAQRIKTIAYAVATPAEGSLPYLGLESVRSFAGEMVNFRLESATKVEAKGNLAECGDLLFSKLRVYLAKGLIADRAYRCSSEFVVLRLKKNVRADKDFVLYVLISEAFTSFIDAFSYGVKMPRISPTRLMQQLLPLPPKRQQHRIVEYLNVITAEIDGLVEKLQREVELLERYRRELIARTVTRGLDPDVPMKDSGIDWIGEVPTTWRLLRIAALYDLRSQKVSDKDYPPLSITMHGVVPQLETVAKTNDGDNRKLVKAGDFVINSRSDRRGACGISPQDGSCSLINIVLAPQH